MDRVKRAQTIAQRNEIKIGFEEIAGRATHSPIEHSSFSGEKGEEWGGAGSGSVFGSLGGSDQRGYCIGQDN